MCSRVEQQHSFNGLIMCMSQYMGKSYGKWNNKRFLSYPRDFHILFGPPTAK